MADTPDFAWLAAALSAASAARRTGPRGGTTRPLLQMRMRWRTQAHARYLAAAGYCWRF